MLDYKIVNVIIDGKRIAVPADYTVLKACESIGISIPRLCFLEGIHEEANCRMCVVKIKGINGLKALTFNFMSFSMISFAITVLGLV